MHNAAFADLRTALRYEDYREGLEGIQKTLLILPSTKARKTRSRRSCRKSDQPPPPSAGDLLRKNSKP